LDQQISLTSGRRRLIKQSELESRQSGGAAAAAAAAAPAPTNVARRTLTTTFSELVDQFSDRLASEAPYRKQFLAQRRHFRPSSNFLGSSGSDDGASSRARRDMPPRRAQAPLQAAASRSVGARHIDISAPASGSAVGAAARSSHSMRKHSAAAAQAPHSSAMSVDDSSSSSSSSSPDSDSHYSSDAAMSDILE
jgi:hypothetical protein